jgi:hypothetical protein
VKDEEIDKVLQRGLKVPQELEPAMLKRITDSIHPSLRAVRVLPPPWALTAALVFICASVALVAASRTGFDGIRSLALWQSGLIFLALAILGWALSRGLVAELTPGSRHFFSPYVLFICAGVALLVVFAIVFRDYHNDHFVSAGMGCLLAGLETAIPAALLSWLVLRRGFAVRPVAAALLAGSLAGLSGLAMLELQCANFQALHVLVWHTAVVAVCAAVGALAGWSVRSRL